MAEPNHIPLLFEPSKMTSGAVRERQRQLHLCAYCTHKEVCVASKTVAALEKDATWLLAISNCAQFEREPESADTHLELIR